MRQMELKVFSGYEMVNGKQVAVILAAPSQRQAFAALQGAGLPTSIRTLAAYWSITGNAKQCAIALAAPGTVFAASSLDSDDFAPLPKCDLVKVKSPPPPKIPTDPEGKKQYNKIRREVSDKNKRGRGEVRITSWLPADAAAALDKITGGSRERGAVQRALALALTSYMTQPGAQKAA